MEYTIYKPSEHAKTGYGYNLTPAQYFWVTPTDNGSQDWSELMSVTQLSTFIFVSPTNRELTITPVNGYAWYRNGQLTNVCDSIADCEKEIDSDYFNSLPIDRSESALRGE